VADFEVIWGLNDKGWATAQAGDMVAIPFWPEREFAAECAIEEWNGFSPKAIPLSEFLTRWLPGLRADHRACLIFSTPLSRGLLLLPEQLQQLIEVELQQY